MNEPETILELWRGYEADALDSDPRRLVGALQRREIRRAYYAGCRAAFFLLKLAASSGRSQAEGLELLARLEAEADHFAHAVANGRA